MAKLVETLEGYNPDMTPEEKAALLESYELPEPPEPKPEPQKPIPEKAKPVPLKDQFDKLSSEYAALKKQLRAKMSEEEQRAAEIQEREAAREAELETLRKEKKVSTHTSRLLGLGFDETLAKETAQFLVEGDEDGLFSNMKKFTDTTIKKALAEALKDTPRPPTSEAEAASKKAEDERLDAAFGLI